MGYTTLAHQVKLLQDTSSIFRTQRSKTRKRVVEAQYSDTLLGLAACFKRILPFLMHARQCTGNACVYTCTWDSYTLASQGPGEPSRSPYSAPRNPAPGHLEENGRHAADTPLSFTPSNQASLDNEGVPCLRVSPGAGTQRTRGY